MSGPPATRFKTLYVRSDQENRPGTFNVRLINRELESVQRAAVSRKNLHIHAGMEEAA